MSDTKDSGNERPCPACGLEADAVGVLDNGDTIYLHDSSYCLHEPADTGLLGQAIDQLEAHMEADS